VRITGRRLSRRRAGKLACQSACRLQPRDGPRERPQHAAPHAAAPMRPIASEPEVASGGRITALSCEAPSLALASSAPTRCYPAPARSPSSWELDLIARRLMEEDKPGQVGQLLSDERRQHTGIGLSVDACGARE